MGSSNSSVFWNRIVPLMLSVAVVLIFFGMYLETRRSNRLDRSSLESRLYRAEVERDDYKLKYEYYRSLVDQKGNVVHEQAHIYLYVSSACTITITQPKNSPERAISVRFLPEASAVGSANAGFQLQALVSDVEWSIDLADYAMEEWEGTAIILGFSNTKTQISGIACSAINPTVY